jgi:hypothetical protein
MDGGTHSEGFKVEDGIFGGCVGKGGLKSLVRVYEVEAHTKGAGICKGY